MTERSLEDMRSNRDSGAGDRIVSRAIIIHSFTNVIGATVCKVEYTTGQNIA